MHIIICDICKLDITSQKKVMAGVDKVFASHVFCLKCGEDIILFMEKHSLLTERELQKVHP